MALRTVESGGWGHGSHPLLDASAALHRDLDDAHAAVASGTDPAWLSATEQGLLLESLGRARARLDALLVHTLAVTGAAGGVSSLNAARSPADWLAHRLHVGPARLVADAKLGAALDRRPILETAHATGRVSTEHARVVVEVLDQIPTTAIDPETMTAAERVLVGHCDDFTPPEIRRLGLRLLEAAAPGVADAIEARRLAEEERAARRTTTLRLHATDHGTRRITGEIPELHATVLESALRAFTNPRRADHPDGIPTTAPTPSTTASTNPGTTPGTTVEDGQRLTDAQRLGQAFCTLVEHLPTQSLPTHGGSPVTVVVTIPEQSLRQEAADAAGLGMLETGQPLSLGEVRRLGCQHGIRPAVLGSASEVLDLGRQQRLFTHAQRLALSLAHPQCQARGCTVPADWCEAHHRGTPWAAGGRTDLAEGALLCSHHHHRTHDPTYDTTWHPDHTATFHRRC